jgi:DHA1 family bicyclomycin/chloramphenicol resistance-like MFS transporter
MPSCNTMAMEAHGAIAGTAAALMGALGFGAGALGTFLVGAFADGTPLPLYLTITVFALAGMTTVWTSFGESGAPKIEAAKAG